MLSSHWWVDRSSLVIGDRQWIVLIVFQSIYLLQLLSIRAGACRCVDSAIHRGFAILACPSLLVLKIGIRPVDAL